LMKTLVIYDSVFGNTEKIAKAIAKGVNADLLQVDSCTIEKIKGFDYLVLGSPTRAFKPTEKISAFIKSLPMGSLNGVKVMAFDTRLDVKEVGSKILTVMESIFGYAAAPMQKRLISKGGSKVAEPEGFFVKESEGPLREGEEQRATEWGKRYIK